MSIGYHRPDVFSVMPRPQNTSDSMLDPQTQKKDGRYSLKTAVSTEGVLKSILSMFDLANSCAPMLESVYLYTRWSKVAASACFYTSSSPGAATYPSDLYGGLALIRHVFSNGSVFSLHDVPRGNDTCSSYSIHAQ
jgi:hypothetical protein